MGFTDDELGRNVFFPKSGAVISESAHLAATGRILYLHMVVDIPDDPPPDWNGPERPMLPPPERISKKARAVGIRNKRIRMAQTRLFLWYCGFLVSFCVVLAEWINIGNAFTMRQAIQTNVIEEDFSLEASFFQKGFADVANGEEMYMYLNDIIGESIGAEDGGAISEYTTIIGPVRVRQQRIQINIQLPPEEDFIDTDDGYDKDKPWGGAPPFDMWTAEAYEEAGCIFPTKYLNWTKSNEVLCYPAWGTGVKSEENYGEPIKNEDGLLAGRFTYTSGGLTGLSTPGQLASYSAGGFIVDLPLDKTFALGIAELEASEYVDLATRVVFIEFLCYNPNLGMFTLAKLLFEYSAGGVVTPSFIMMPFELGNSIPWYVYLFQATFACYVSYFWYVFIKEMREVREDLGTYVPFFLDGWNVLDGIIYLAALAFYIMCFIYWAMDSRSEFDITAHWYQDMNSVADFSAMISNINAINFLLATLKLFKYMVMSDQFKMLTDTVINAAPDVGTFMVMLIVVILSFTVSGLLLFGTTIEGFSTLTRTFNTLFLVMLGDFDYQELVDVTALFAPIWFIAYQVVVFMILLNMFIGIINFSFSLEHAKPKDELASEVKNLMSRAAKGIRNLYWTKPDPNQGNPREYFDPVTDEVQRVFSKEDKKLLPYPSFPGIPRDNVMTTARLNKKQYAYDNGETEKPTEQPTEDAT